MEFNNDPIKEAFLKVKKDILFLSNEISQLRLEIDDLKGVIMHSHKIDNQTENPTNNITDSSTIRHIISTGSVNTTDNSTHSSTVPYEIEGLKNPNFGVSIGNEGASTDRQTDRQTDSSTHNIQEKTIDSDIKKASEILNSLDHLKKEIRLKFRRLTDQEMAVFSTIYQLEEQNYEEITYKQIAKNLKLSESSIRDYVQRMVHKGISIKKNKINNKKILLSISPDLKRIASLPIILSLREL